METVLIFLAAYALGVSQNASWDAIKHLIGKVFGSASIDVQRLYVNAFIKAIDLHSTNSEQFVQEYLAKLRSEIVRDRKVLLDSLEALSYQDYGILLASLETQEFQIRLASELMSRCSPASTDIETIVVELEAVESDFIGYFRISLVQHLSSAEAQRLALLQSMKIDSIRTSIEELRQEIASKTIFVSLVPDARGQLTRELQKYQRLLAREYASHRAMIDSSVAQANREVMLKDIQRILYAKGFRNVPIKEPEIDVVAETKGIFSTRIALSINANLLPMSVTSVELFRDHYPRTRASAGYLVSTGGFTSEAVEVADGNVKLYSYEEFTGELVDFREYIQQIIETYEQTALARTYQRMRGYSVNDDENIDLVSAIDNTFEAEKSRKIAIFANFGMGKTTFAKHYLYLLAKRYLDNPVGNRIPVFVSLAQHERAAGIQATITYALQQQGVDINSQLCLELQKMGRFVFIFDGFDEMTLHPDKIAVQQNLQELEKVSQIGANRFILTSRTHFFKDKLDQERLVGYTFLHIHEWGRRQFESYLRASLGSDWQAVRDRIVDSAALWELAKTPLFVEMMATTVPDMQDMDVSATQLFEVFTDRWINSQDYRSFMLSSEKRSFMSHLACLLFFGDRFSVHYSELRDVVRTTFNLQVIEDVDYFDNDTRTCSFLVRDDRGYYRFSHRSFMEYFVARTLAAEIPSLVLSAEKSESLEDYRFLRRKLSNEVYMFLASMSLDHEVLLRLVHATRSKNFDDVRYLGSNAISVLKEMGEDLSGADLSGCVMVDADFGGMNLSRTDFTNSDLYTVNFNNCVLNETNMTGANLRYASIKGLNGIFDVLPEVYDNVSAVGTMLRSLFLVDLGEKVIDRLDGHSDGIWALAQLGKDPWVASGGRDHTVQLWNVASHDLIRAFDGHFDNVWRIVADPSGKRLASCSSDRTVKIWDATSVAPEAVLTRHSDEVRDIVFVTPEIVLSCGLDKRLIEWNIRSGATREFQGDEEFVSLSFATNAQLIALGDTVGRIVVLAYPSLEVVSTHKVHNGAVRALACNELDNRFASGGGDGKLLFGDLNDFGTVREVAEHTGFINQVRFSRDGTLITSVGYDSSVHMVSVAAGKVTKIQKYNLGEALYGAGNRFSCAGLILTGSKGLSPERLRDLQDRGAIL